MKTSFTADLIDNAVREAAQLKPANSPPNQRPSVRILDDPLGGGLHFGDKLAGEPEPFGFIPRRRVFYFRQR